MYPVENVYSIEAYEAWRQEVALDEEIELRNYRRSSSEILNGPFWEVCTWDELRAAVSFLTLMNKRHVLYFRGQQRHYDRCLPALFRPAWYLAGQPSPIPLGSANRGRYHYVLLQELCGLVLKVAMRIGTPRSYILEHVPAAAASILQHYELWPTHFVDVTRSLPTAIAFARGLGDAERAYVYVFAMPDLRGSITSDMDQHLTLSRLEAICPPDAKRPHHQDAYLVSRFPEPSGSATPGDLFWDDWQSKTDLMRRLVAKFLVRLERGSLPGAPAFDLEFLVPSIEADKFCKALYETVLPVVQRHVANF